MWGTRYALRLLRCSSAPRCKRQTRVISPSSEGGEGAPAPCTDLIFACRGLFGGLLFFTPVLSFYKTSPRLLTEGRAFALCFAFCALRFAFCASHFVLCALCFARYSLFCIISMRFALVLLSSRRRAFSTASRVSSSIFWVDFITVRRFASLRLFISRMLLVWVSHITA